MKMKKVTEYTDRELLEKITLFSKATADNTAFIKTVLIVMVAVSIIGGVIALSLL